MNTARAVTWVLWRRRAARFLTVDIWRLRLFFRASTWSGQPHLVCDWWWKDDYQMHHWLGFHADRFGDRAYGKETT